MPRRSTDAGSPTREKNINSLGCNEGDQGSLPTAPLHRAKTILLHRQKTSRREREISAGRPRQLRGESPQGLYFAAVLPSLGLAAYRYKYFGLETNIITRQNVTARQSVKHLASCFPLPEDRAHAAWLEMPRWG